MIDTTVISLFWQASIIVKVVMLFLLGASIISWSLIMHHNRQIREVDNEVQAIEKDLRATQDFSKIYKRYVRKNSISISNIYALGYVEFTRFGEQNLHPELRLDMARQAMQVETKKILLFLEKNLNILATIQSTSPYIGLFGTVWGIMSSFQQLGNVQQASLNVVAPGIAEALIATAMGLIAAIPAGIFYNRLISKVDYINSKVNTFCEELLIIWQRQLYIPV